MDNYKNTLGWGDAVRYQYTEARKNNISANEIWQVQIEHFLEYGRSKGFASSKY